MTEHRLLGDKEILQQGDQYQWHGKWCDTKCAGDTVAENGTHVFDYRREVDHGRSTAENQ